MLIPDAEIGERSVTLFKRRKWLPLEDKINVMMCSLIYKRFKDDECPSYPTQLLPKKKLAQTYIAGPVERQIIT